MEHDLHFSFRDDVHASSYEQGALRNIELVPSRFDYPDRSAIGSALGFVRLNCGTRPSAFLEAKTIPSREVASQLLPLMAPGARPVFRDGSIAEAIWQTISQRKFRRGPRAQLEGFDGPIREQIAQAVALNRPLEMVLPSFPFKDLSPWSTGHSPGFVDLGEYLAIRQLGDLCASIRSVYPPGARMIVLCDGHVYEEMFGEAGICGHVDLYMRRCRLARDQLGLRDVVEFVDMADVVGQDVRFRPLRAWLARELQNPSHLDASAQKRMSTLVEAMRVNVPMPGADKEIGLRSTPTSQLPPELRLRCQNAAVGYASFLIATAWLDLINRAFPRSVRCTVHPKAAAQLPLWMASNKDGLLPYNGVPLVSRSALERYGSLRRATRVVRLWDAAPRQDLVAVCRTGDTEPFYYEAA